MRRYRLLGVEMLLLAAAVGCAADRQPLRQKLLSPGPAPYQRQQAQRFDPYNEIQVGPRDDTSRPPDYLAPNPEPSRGRWFEWGLPRFGHP